MAHGSWDHGITARSLISVSFFASPPPLSASNAFGFAFIFVRLSDQKIICLSDCQSKIDGINRIRRRSGERLEEGEGEGREGREAGRARQPDT